MPKKIINRKMYNTETAALIGEWSNGRSGSDFCHCREELYLTKKGNLFLYGIGGPMSPYNSRYGDAISGDWGILPLTLDKAIEWCEEKDQDALQHSLFDGIVEEA